jgi:hypothetical protein
VIFDLQSPGRRRVVRITFGALAAVFAVSFVFLGVGTGGGGFSFSDLFGGGGGGSSSSAFDSDIKAAEQQLQVNPQDTAALANLVRLHYSAAVQAVNSDGTLSSDGEQQLREGADAWSRYVKLSKGNIETGAATFALQTFEQLGNVDFQKARSDTTNTEALTDAGAAVDDWKNAALAQQALIQAQPNKASANSYARLATYLYLSGQAPAGDQAAAQAKQKAGATNASSLDSQLKPIQQLGQQLQTAITQLTKQQQAQGATGGGATGGGGNPLGGLSGGFGGSGGTFGGP